MSPEPAPRMLRLPGDAPLPDWVARLERTAFGSTWKAPAPHEVLWVVPELAFARWACIPAAGEAELLRIAVDPAHRGGGLGRLLLEACQRELADAGLDRLYRACGWVPCGHRAGYYPDGEDAALYRRTGL